MENKSTTSESSIEKYFTKTAKAMGMRSFKMLPTYETGIPDRLVLYRGFSGFAEIKAFGKKPRKLQVIFLDELEKAGSFVGIVDDIDSAWWWLLSFKEFVDNKIA